MTARVKIQLNLKGINALMTSPGVDAQLGTVAKRIQTTAGAGHTVNRRPHKYTARYYVDQTRKKARKDPTGQQLLAALAASKR